MQPSGLKTCAICSKAWGLHFPTKRRCGEGEPPKSGRASQALPGEAGSGSDFRSKVRWRMSKYEVIIYWSQEDDAFIAEVPQLAGCTAHGASQDEALRNAQDATELWIETAKEFGDPIPEPVGRRLVFA